MHPRRDTPPDLSSFAVQAMRAYFDAQPPKLQRETMARVSQLVAQHPQSYLARHWRAMYLDAGIVPAPRILRLLGIAKEVKREG